jgi:hypothetical protein
MAAEEIRFSSVDDKTKEVVIELFCEVFKRINPRFNSVKFTDACYGK